VTGSYDPATNLQTRQPVVAGEKFACSINFQKAGTIETEVNVQKLRADKTR
jgi:hypothetical protein